MATYETMDPREGNERRKNVLQRLMAQVQARNAAGGAPMQSSGAMRTAGGYGGQSHVARNQVTRAFDIDPAVRSRLGPGGFTPPVPGWDASPSPGIPITPPMRGVPVPTPPMRGVPVPPPPPPPRDGSGGRPPTIAEQFRPETWTTVPLADRPPQGYNLGADIAPPYQPPPVFYDPELEIFHAGGRRGV